MILLDGRVGSVELAEPLTAIGVGVGLVNLEFGDASFIGNGPSGRAFIGVERKTVSDLLSSMTTGRLSGHQLIGLLRDYDYCYLLVEGIWRGNPETGTAEKFRHRQWEPISIGRRLFMKRDIDNYLNTLSVLCRIRPWFTGSLKESARWLAGLHAWWNKEWDCHTSHLRFNQSARTPGGKLELAPPTVLMRVASALDGVGYEKSRAIGTVFKSAQAFVDADADALLKVPGIGRTLAGSIRSQLEKEQ